MGQALWENPALCHQVCMADHSPVRAAASMFLRKAAWTPLSYKATFSHYLGMTYEAHPSPHKTAQPLSPTCLPSGPCLTMMSTTPPQGPGVRAKTIFPGGASVFDPGTNLWRPLYYHPTSGDPSSQLWLSTSCAAPRNRALLSGLPHPLPAEVTACSLSLSFSVIIIPSMEKLLAADQRQGCPQRHFPSRNIPPLLRCSSTWTSPHRF